MDFLRDASDPWLKPTLLRRLATDRLPDVGRPLPSPSHLSSLLSLVRDHDLLSESLPPWVPGPTDSDKLAPAWSAAVDAWVDRCLALAASNMPDNRWAGICLLGLTCEMCASDRFLRSYSVWFQALLPNVQPPADSHFVKMASCAFMLDLFTRLSRFPNVKKDATSLASKLAQPVLQLLSNESTDTLLVGALDLLGTLLTLFPFSVYRHYEEVEAVIVRKLFSEKCGSGIHKKLARSLSLLPTVRGKDNSWITMMQEILVSINMCLTDAFRGLEEESRSAKFIRLLVPPGEDPPPPLGGQSISAAGDQAAKRFQEVLLPRVYTLMQCCCAMITNSYPIQVTLPVRPLISLVERVLSVDGCLHETLSSFSSEFRQQIICSELPALHLNCLDVLIAVIKALRSQLLPYATNVIRMLTEYLERATLPCLRIKVFSIMQALLTSMGVGMAPYCLEELVNSAFTHLNPSINENNLQLSRLDHSKVAGESTMHNSSKKRKHVSDTVAELQAGANLGKESINKKLGTPLSVQIAVLGALETLITVAGSLRADDWRPSVDHLLITVAENACSMGWVNMKKNNLLESESSSTLEDFQLAALQALLASLLSHAHVRPPFLSEGLKLFRRGTQEVGTKVAAFCTHAMLALEVLIHPRTLPLMDFPVTKGSVFNGVSDHQPYSKLLRSQNTQLLLFPRESHRAVNDLMLDDDDRLDNGEQTIGVTSKDEHMVDVDGPGRTVEEPCPDNRVPTATSVDLHQLAGGSRDNKCTADADISSGGQDENLFKVGKSEEPVFKDPIIYSARDKAPAHQVVTTSDISSGQEIALGIGAKPRADEVDLQKDVDASVESSLVPGKGNMVSYDSDSPSLDSLPDIVDADPDTD